MKLIIDRGSWLRGEGPDASRLLRYSDLKMCCLGALGKACGLSDDQLYHKYSPEGTTDRGRWPDGILSTSYDDEDNECFFDSGVTGDLMEINDDKNLSEAEREAMLIEKFATIGIEVEFVG